MVADTITRYDVRGDWDVNFDSGQRIKQMDEFSSIHYLKTKKVAVVSSRDQYLNLKLRTVEPEDSPSGFKRKIIAHRSIDFDELPPKDGIVRASVFLTGWVLEQIEPNLVDVNFMIVSDYKISLFVQKQTAPK